jgi:hypothetical protein
MERERITYLYQQYLQGKASPKELEQWQKIINDPLLKDSLDKILDQGYYQISQQEILDLDGNRSEEIYEYVISHPADEKPLIKKLWPKVIIAAAIAAIMVTAGILFFNNSRHETNPDQTLVNDIKPGKQGATLTLSSGRKIELSDLKSGVVIGKDLKYKDGTTDRALSQSDISPAKGESSMTLTASTAKGQTYQFQLPDGTNVWLNAESKISFPSQFTGANRKVELSGEGYFEVAKDKLHPFIVKTAQQEVEVLGTHFNINSYKDEAAIRTTLLEGSVQVTSIPNGTNEDGLSRVLKPNQQAILKGDTIKVLVADTELAVAWKNNQFMFDEESIQHIMKMVERWYNVEVIYEGQIPDDKFGGAVSRFDNVSSVVRILETTKKVHFRIEGKKIYVFK